MYNNQRFGKNIIFNMDYFIGVDVGTSSARAALVTAGGQVERVAIKAVQIHQPDALRYEQSSDEVWSACLYCIKQVIHGIPAEKIKGLGFDATCSLVAIDEHHQPVPICNTSGDNVRNIIMWLDHRAAKEADVINATEHDVLRFVGGKVSLEMEMPKLMWLKANVPECYHKTRYFFDLPDFLTWKATGSTSRSLCSMVCKWNYEILDDMSMQWNRQFLQEIGLEELLRDADRIGDEVKAPGGAVGTGLCQTVAEELGLRVGTPVGVSIIDAHAGGLGLIGCQVDNLKGEFSTRLSLICGTSTCHMAVSTAATQAAGIWGPYYSAMVPGMWLNEAGQSVTGKLVDHIIETHPATPHINAKLDKMHIQEYLTQLLHEMSARQGINVDMLTKDVHVWPDFHGNRSPIADPTLKGMVSGLSLATDEENLAVLYLATVQALSYGTRHIIETLVDSGYKPFDSILICGGLSKNPLFVQSQANTTGLPVVVPEETESVLLGAAILAACAANYFADINAAISCMGGKGKLVQPEVATGDYHQRKYQVYKKMLADQLEYRRIMQ